MHAWRSDSLGWSASWAIATVAVLAVPGGAPVVGLSRRGIVSKAGIDGAERMGRDRCLWRFLASHYLGRAPHALVSASTRVDDP